MNRKILHLFVFLLILFMLPLESSGRPQTQEIILDGRGLSLHSSSNGPAILHLKQIISREYPSLDLSATQLRRVIVTVKSLAGPGRVQLRVGSSTSAALKVATGQNYFPGREDRSRFEKIAFTNPARDSRGRWQLLFTGDFVIGEIVLIVDSTARRAGVDLPNSHWGTMLEGEKSCRVSSDNTADGWQAPQNICSSGGLSSYKHGYPPVQLFIRPDITPLHRYNMRRVESITVSATALSRNRAHHGHETVSFGIDIAGKTYRRTFSLAPAGLREGDEHVQTLHISGSWKPAEIAQSRVWIQPNQASGDFTVRNLRVQTR